MVLLFSNIEMNIYFFLIFDCYPYYSNHQWAKIPVDSIVRAQAVALSDIGLSQVQISRQLNISRHCVQNPIEKQVNTMTFNEQLVQKNSKS